MQLFTGKYSVFYLFFAITVHLRWKISFERLTFCSFFSLNTRQNGRMEGLTHEIIKFNFSYHFVLCAVRLYSNHSSCINLEPCLLILQLANKRFFFCSTRYKHIHKFQTDKNIMIMNYWWKLHEITTFVKIRHFINISFR